MKAIVLLVLITLAIGQEVAVTDAEKEKGFLQLGVYACVSCNTNPGFAMECQLSVVEKVCCEMDRCMKLIGSQWFKCVGENYGQCF